MLSTVEESTYFETGLVAAPMLAVERQASTSPSSSTVMASEARGKECQNSEVTKISSDPGGASAAACLPYLLDFGHSISKLDRDFAPVVVFVSFTSLQPNHTIHHLVLPSRPGTITRIHLQQ